MRLNSTSLKYHLMTINFGQTIPKTNIILILYFISILILLYHFKLYFKTIRFH